MVWASTNFTFSMRGIISFAVLYLALTCITAEKKIVCYFNSWAMEYPGRGQFDISNIDSSLCTHLIYVNVALMNDTIQSNNPRLDLPLDQGGKDGFIRFNVLRGLNPTIKTLVSITESVHRYRDHYFEITDMVKTVRSREAFVNSAVEFVKKWGFNGLVMDWQNEARLGRAKFNFYSYIEFLKLLRRRFDENGLILSATVAGPTSSAYKFGYIRKMTQYLHFINLMAYNFHDPWKSYRTGINAPLYPSRFNFRGWNVKAVVRYWLNRGVPKDKLILGVSPFGYSFTLKHFRDHKIGALTKGPGNSGPYTNIEGLLGYNEICEEQKTYGNWSVIYDRQTHTPYAYKHNWWISYDNVESISEKAKFVNRYKLGGVMIRPINADDFLGICHGTTYPILRAINKVLSDKTAV